MARQLRIEYPGAFYHIASRGNRKQAIFLADRDRVAFLDIIGEAHQKFFTVIHVYCLMTNHYHLMLETPLGNLSKTMHFINTKYSIHFKKKHSCVGHLFQGRFKAILVEADTYALELSRYIHLNPVRAAIVEDPEEYPWSSYREYLDTASRPTSSWLEKSLVLGSFGRNSTEAKIKYSEYVKEAAEKEIANPFDRLKGGLILGSDDFIARIKMLHIKDMPDNPEVPAIRKLKNISSLEKIFFATLRLLPEEAKLARNTAIFISRKNTDYRLREIAQYFHLGKSAIGKVATLMKTQIAADKDLDRKVKEIEQSIF